MKKLIELSDLAQKLYAFLSQSNGAWENKCLDVLFEKPNYPTTNDRDARIIFWQFECNSYGHVISRPVFELEEKTAEGNRQFESMEFKPTEKLPYADQISLAYAELKHNGLAGEKNSGYNDYFFFAIKQS